MWCCSSAINAELAAVKDRRSAEAVTELAVHLAKKNQRLEKRVSQLEGAMLTSLPAGDNVPLLVEEDVELSSRMSATDVHADLAGKTIESAKSDEQRHRTSAIFFVLRVCRPACEWLNVCAV
jgi:hypothetical protein